MHILRTAVLLTAMAFPTLSAAFDIRPDRVYAPLASYHAGLDPAKAGLAAWNEVNPGLIFSWENRFLGLDYGLGGIRNSFGDFSPILSIGLSYDVNRDLSIGGILSFIVTSRETPSFRAGRDSEKSIGRRSAP